MSVYRQAIEQTDTVIRRRATYFRNQVVTVVVVSLATVVLVLVSGSLTVLTFGLILIPISGLFLVADYGQLNQWRSSLMSAWTTGQLDLAVFCHTIRAHPKLPTQTLEAMLATLPSAGGLVEEQAILTPTRQALSAETAAEHHTRSDALLFKVVASGIVVSASMTALWTRSWWPLVGLSALVLVPVVRLWAKGRRRARCEAEVALCRAQAGFSETDYTRLRASLLG